MDPYHQDSTTHGLGCRPRGQWTLLWLQHSSRCDGLGRQRSFDQRQLFVELSWDLIFLKPWGLKLTFIFLIALIFVVPVRSHHQEGVVRSSGNRHGLLTAKG